MKSSKTAFERRIEILFLLSNNIRVTAIDLCKKFNVSRTTINTDISFLSRYAPIVSQMGSKGGFSLIKGYSNTLFRYLSKDEEKLLSELKDNLEPSKQNLIQGIIDRFSLPT